MTERELLELIATQVGTLTKDVTEIKKDLAGVKTDLDEVKTDLDEVKTDLDEVKTDLGEVKTDLDEVKTDLDEVKTDLDEVKIRVIRIENDHGLKLNALFDGYKQNAEKLDRIEKAVAKHEETLLTKVK